MNTFDKLEARLQSMIENELVKLIPGFRPKDEISQKLASVMYSQVNSNSNVDDLAPNLYVVIAHPSYVSKWRQDPGFLAELANSLEMAGKEANIRFASKVTITVSPNTSMSKREIRIIGSFSLARISETQGMIPKTVQDEGNHPNNSYLIQSDSKVIQLCNPVMNIGRRLDNQIVIDDPRVSRNHAQIREIKGHFVIFDLNSKGGTFVNGDRINQSILFPGDVLSLAGVTLIFGQDLTSSEAKELTTQPNASMAAGAVLPDEISSL